MAMKKPVKKTNNKDKPTPKELDQMLKAKQAVLKENKGGNPRATGVTQPSPSRSTREATSTKTMLYAATGSDMRAMHKKLIKKLGLTPGQFEALRLSDPFGED